MKKFFLVFCCFIGTLEASQQRGRSGLNPRGKGYTNRGGGKNSNWKQKKENNNVHN